MQKNIQVLSIEEGSLIWRDAIIYQRMIEQDQLFLKTCNKNLNGVKNKCILSALAVLVQPNIVQANGGFKTVPVAVVEKIEESGCKNKEVGAFESYYIDKVSGLKYQQRFHVVPGKKKVSSRTSRTVNKMKVSTFKESKLLYESLVYLDKVSSVSPITNQIREVLASRNLKLCNLDCFLKFSKKSNEFVIRGGDQNYQHLNNNLNNTPSSINNDGKENQKLKAVLRLIISILTLGTAGALGGFLIYKHYKNNSHLLQAYEKYILLLDKQNVHFQILEKAIKKFCEGPNTQSVSFFCNQYLVYKNLINKFHSELEVLLFDQPELIEMMLKLTDINLSYQKDIIHQSGRDNRSLAKNTLNNRQ